MGARTKSQRRATWRQRLARFERAGVTVAEFCRREGVSVPSFYQWRKKLAATSASPGRGPTQSPPANHTPTPFVELALPLAARVEIELVSGAIVRLPLGRPELLVCAIQAASQATPLRTVEEVPSC